MSDLANCPFCDRSDSTDNAVQEASVILAQRKAATGGRAYRVECTCGASGALAYDPGLARALWNSRPTTTAHTKED